MKAVRRLGFIGTAVALIAGVIGGICLVAITGAAPARAAFEGEILVSWRGGGDIVETTPSKVSAPMFYTTPKDGAIGGVDGNRPTGVWAPGDSWQRSLVVKNQSDTYAMELKQLKVSIPDNQGLAAMYTLTVTDARGTALYRGVLTGAVDGVTFSQPVTLKPGQHTSLEFTATLDLNTSNSLQGRTVKANFEVQGEALIREMIIDIHHFSDPNGVNPRSRGNMPVAINGSATFHVEDLVPASARFGPNEVHPVENPGPGIEDWNGDSYPDLILHFQTDQVGIACDTTSLSMTIQDVDGVTYEGSDAVKVNCR